MGLPEKFWTLMPAPGSFDWCVSSGSWIYRLSCMHPTFTFAAYDIPVGIITLIFVAVTLLDRRSKQWLSSDPNRIDPEADLDVWNPFCNVSIHSTWFSDSIFKLSLHVTTLHCLCLHETQADDSIPLGMFLQTAPPPKKPNSPTPANAQGNLPPTLPQKVCACRDSTVITSERGYFFFNVVHI